MPGQYDVAIIGAGVGGLLTGNYLARRGFKTVLLEQHVRPGGCVCGFARQGFYFDGGDQSFGSSGIVFPILKELGLLPQLKFMRADYRWVTPWADFKVDSLAQVKRAVAEAFPDSAAELDAYFAELEILAQGVLSWMERPNPLLLTGAARLWGFARMLLTQPTVMRRMTEALQTPGLELARRHLSNPLLSDFFGRFGYRGSSAASTAGAWATWIYDYWYPMGGLQGFVDLLARSYVEHGAELRLRTRVVRVEVEGARAAGVTTAGGETIPARFVVSAGDYRRLVQELLPEGTVPPEHAAETAQSPVSDAIFSVFLGLDLPPAVLRQHLQTHHVFVQPRAVPLPEGERDRNWHASRWVEISSPTLTDPTLAPEGCSSVILQVMSSYQWMDRWGTGPHGERTAEYRALKEHVARQVMYTAEQVIPALTEHIVIREAATPLTHERYTLNSEGATAGWTWDPRLTPIKSPAGRYTTPVPGLFQAGHWTHRIGGVPSAALSARLVADLITREAR